MLIKNDAWLIGNGASISIYGDRWAGAKAKLWSNGSQLNEVMVKDLFEEVKFSWNVEKVRSMFDIDITQAILATLIMGVEEDRRIWPFTKDGQYSVKTGYKCALLDLKAASTSSSEPYGSGDRDVLIKASLEACEFLSASLKRDIPGTQGNLSRNKPKWRPPSEDTIKFNVDAATDLPKFKAKALKAAISLGLSSIIIEFDSKVVIDFYMGKSASWLLDSILSPVLDSLPPNIVICFSNVPKSATPQQTSWQRDG
ncbi:hypothetical protein G2W53_040568 [Senna tora]|uniref:RNase H type-1 domain-containing protein n=1 Tax=Senna tora TaxID=362788 RepID=A0A834VY30_9FABA|nr:hypothetical protein G2W53_040568 [Senna tora]